MNRRSLLGSIGLALVACGLGTAPYASAQQANQGEERLVCIGALAAAQIYTFYSYIGAAADLYSHQAYKPEQVQDLMKEVMALCDVSIEKLRKVRDGNIVDSDKKLIDDFVTIFQDLQRQASALSAYTKSRDKKDQKAFEDSRATVWPKIRAVLKFEEPPRVTIPAPGPQPTPADR